MCRSRGQQRQRVRACCEHELSCIQVFVFLCVESRAPAQMEECRPSTACAPLSVSVQFAVLSSLHNNFCLDRLLSGRFPSSQLLRACACPLLSLCFHSGPCLKDPSLRILVHGYPVTLQGKKRRTGGWTDSPSCVQQACHAHLLLEDASGSKPSHRHEVVCEVTPVSQM